MIIIASFCWVSFLWQQSWSLYILSLSPLMTTQQSGLIIWLTDESVKFRRVNTAANKQPNFDPHSLTPEHTVFYPTGLLDTKYLHERLTLETNIDMNLAIKTYISILLTLWKTFISCLINNKYVLFRHLQFRYRQSLVY